MENLSESSISFIRLRSRLALTLDHLNIVDKALLEISVAKGSDGALARHSIVRNAELAIQLLYTHLTEYLRLTISGMYSNKPLEVVNKANSSFQYHEIVRLGSYEAICDKMIDHVFRTLEKQRSTKTLIENILDKTGIVIKDSILEDSMFYIEIRHLIVHNSSMIDENFVKKYSFKFRYAKVGNKLPTSVGMARKGITSIRNLCSDMDKQLLYKGYLNPHFGSNPEV